MAINRDCSQKGVTLMELLVVIGLMAILLAIAIPGMDIIQTSRLNGAARTVWRDIHLARVTAVKENMEIQVVFSGQGYHFERVLDIQDNEIFFARDIADEFRDDSIEISNRSGNQTFSLNFRSKGTMNPPAQTIRVSLGDETRQFTVLSSGRIGGIHGPS
jgi:prepilin-type N-terminal cleavage/methylation domain-containing protein